MTESTNNGEWKPAEGLEPVDYDSLTETSEFYFDLGPDDIKRTELAVEAGWPLHLEESWKAHQMLFNGAEFGTDEPEIELIIEEPSEDEIRLRELWRIHGQQGLTQQQYREFTTKVFAVPAEKGAPCTPCKDMDKDLADPRNDAVAGTQRCKGHLRDEVMYVDKNGERARRVTKGLSLIFKILPEAS